jgi:hypothetical protein
MDHLVTLNINHLALLMWPLHQTQNMHSHFRYGPLCHSQYRPLGTLYLGHFIRDTRFAATVSDSRHDPLGSHWDPLGPSQPELVGQSQPGPPGPLTDYCNRQPSHSQLRPSSRS